MTPSTYLPEHFLPVAVFLLIGTAMGLGMLIAGWFIRPRNPYPEKLLTYESGITPFMDAHQKFSIRYYIIAMLFLIFDIEAVFLYPWAVVFRELRLFAFVEMLVFVVLILAGFFYIWKKGALDWSGSDLSNRKQ